MLSKLKHKKSQSQINPIKSSTPKLQQQMSRQSLPINTERVADLKKQKQNRESEMAGAAKHRRTVEERNNQRRAPQEKSLSALAEASVNPGDFWNTVKKKGTKALDLKPATKAEGTHINEIVNWPADEELQDRKAVTKKVSSKMTLPVIQMQDKEDMADNAALSNMCERPGGYASHRPGRAPSYFTTRDITL